MDLDEILGFYMKPAVEAIAKVAEDHLLTMYEGFSPSRIPEKGEEA